MLTTQAIAYARLGKLAREFADFKESTPVTNPSELADITKALQIGKQKRITKLVGVTIDEDGTYEGEFQQYVNPRLTKRFSFTFGENELTFGSLNTDEIEKFSEAEDFARASKSGRAGKALNCKIEQCGGKCLRGGQKCRLTPNPEQKKLWASASGKNRATKPDTSLAKKRRETAEQKRKSDGDGTAKPKNVTSLDSRRKLAKVNEAITEADAANKKFEKTAKKARTTADKLGVGKAASAADNPKAKVHAIKTYSDFEPAALRVIDKLNKNADKDGLVPIYKIRREMGETVSRDKFKEHLLELQNRGKVRLQGGSIEDSAKDKIQDSITTKVSGLRCYAKLEISQKELDAAVPAAKRDKVDKLLKNRPELDPIGTASELRKGEKIKTQAEADKTFDTAYKKLNDEFNHNDMVPISQVRKALGDRVTKDEFDKFIKESQANDRYQLVGSDTATKEEKEGGIESKISGTKVYMKKL